MVPILERSLTVPSQTRSLKEVRAFVEEVLRGARLSERGQRLMILGIDEAVTNIIRHRSRRPGEAEIAIRVGIDDVRVRVVIEDRGQDADLGTLPAEALERRLRGEAVRCVGIFVIRQVVDEVTYRFKKGFLNELELIKFTP